MSLFRPNLLDIFVHNGLAAIAGAAVPTALNLVQSLVTHSPYLAAHHGAAIVVGVLTGAIVRDVLKTYPAFALSSGVARPAVIATGTVASKLSVRPEGTK